jgi:hypothetical protein
MVRVAYAAGAVCALAAGLYLLFVLSRAPDAIHGAVIAADADPAKELPVGNVQVSLLDEPISPVRSQTSGSFTIPIPWHLRRGQRISLRFQHPDYQPLELRNISGDRLCIARLTPALHPSAGVGRAEVTITDVVVRYSISTSTTINVGSAVKTFQVANNVNVPCRGHRPCSPDGKWRAASGSTVMDAGPGNEFRNARASCVAGPCPFTRIENGGPELSRDGRTIHVMALNWSDKATFLVEAEVYKTTVSDALRQSFPLILDRALTFTLPANAEGVSIEAIFDRQTIVFPLGPSLYLSWAECQLLVNKDKTLVYRCELKPGYRFAVHGG